ncbi:unnamed protein product [Discula destructiva]
MSDFPITKDCPIFPTGLDLEAHWRAYAKHYDLGSHIQYNTSVLKVNRYETEDKWELYVKDAEGEKVVAFDKVFMANGIQNKTVYPLSPGIESFSGTTMHSMSFKYR